MPDDEILIKFVLKERKIWLKATMNFQSELAGRAAPETHPIPGGLQAETGPDLWGGLRRKFVTRLGGDEPSRTRFALRAGCSVQGLLWLGY